ncbi:hypothetical protein QBC32DRAFT_395153 [Pseudoneurospora amorphoporcata]|uniref:Uncharacterized protein n=1 Tax=Pseudoneurospora amorphoporcata TaxID=241081 RepID=A0AAN6P385_9PEZI|nr:hypothetical protein QBC32DRAFT_395153 [Pseudoneurospora amorphoporcata]
MTTHNEMSSPVEKLPLELKDLICRHMASALHSALHHSSLPEDDPWIFTWTMPHRSARDDPRPPDCQIIQKRLRALSLVSKAWSRSAQRALFAVIPISSSRCLMKLLRSLLLYPKNRRYIRCLIPKLSAACNRFYIGPYNYNPWDDTAGTVTLTHFVDNLGDILFTPIVEELPNGLLLRISLIKHVLDPQLLAAVNYTDYVYRFREILNSALWSVVHLSPLLSALHLRTEHHHCDVLFGYGEEMAYSKRFLEGGRPEFQTLSLHMQAFPCGARTRDLEDLEYDCWMSCIPTIRYITLLGYSSWMNNYIYFLTSLRLLKGFDEAFCVHDPSAHRPSPPLQHNWNTILLRHKETLEELVFDGYRGVRLYTVRRNEHDLRHIARFGPSKTLSCLPELRKLAYLRLPLHFLMSKVNPGCIDQNTPPESLPSPSTAQEALSLVETTFPPSLKRLDIVVYGFHLDVKRVGQIYPLRTITLRF